MKTNRSIANAITRCETKVSYWSYRSKTAEKYSEQKRSQERVEHFKQRCWDLSDLAGFSYQPVGVVIGCPLHW